MGRISTRRRSPVSVDRRAQLQRQQGSSSILDPFSLLLMAVVACVLFVGTAFSQTQPSTVAPHPKETSASGSTVENPFATPWLLTPAASASGETERSKENGESARPGNTAKYTLTPDPFNSTLADAPSALKDAPSSATDKRDTAQRLAAQTPSPALTLKPHTNTLSAKYDISRIGDRGIGKKLNFYSIEKEEALGRELSLEVEQQAKMISDPVVTEYVNRVGQTLVRHSDAQVPFTIRVIDDEQVNAFALPGGFFYVNSGTILAADNEAELAGVMAHEIAHVAARHATRNATKQDIWNLASLPLIFVAGPVGAAIRQVSSIAVPMSFLKFSRDAEREADFLGLEYQYSAGYDPAAFVDFFEKLEGQRNTRGGFMARAFSTHPMNDDRIHRAEAELEMLPSRNDYILTTSEFDEVKARLLQITRGRVLGNGGPGRPVLRKPAGKDDKPPVLRKTGIAYQPDGGPLS